MKTFPLTINKREFLLCEVPVGSTSHSLSGSTLTALLDFAPFAIELDPGNYKLIGPYPGLTEIQAAEIVQSKPIIVWHGKEKRRERSYFNYIKNHHDYHLSALESLASKLQAEKIYIGQNPFGEKPKSKGLRIGTFEYAHFQTDMVKWQEAEARTIKQAVILEIIK